LNVLIGGWSYEMLSSFLQLVLILIQYMCFTVLFASIYLTKQINNLIKQCVCPVSQLQSEDTKIIQVLLTCPNTETLFCRSSFCSCTWRSFSNKSASTHTLDDLWTMEATNNFLASSSSCSWQMKRMLQMIDLEGREGQITNEWS
jgi:hypothetical protein